MFKMTEQQKIYKIINKKYSASDKFLYMQVKTFLTKLKGLIKKISRSSNTQIQSHILTCHRLISQLLKDDQVLTNMTSQKLRLLAYQSILYLVQVLDMRKDPAKFSQSLNQKAKIASYLSEINSTMIQVKELLKKCDRDSVSSSRKSYLLSNEGVSSMDKNLNQFAYRLGAIFTQLQKQSPHLVITPPPPQSSTSISYLKPNTTTIKQPQDYKDNIIQQMQRVVQKKEKQILQLTNQKNRVQNQKLLSQNDYVKYKELLKEKNDQLMKELVDMKAKNKQLSLELECYGKVRVEQQRWQVKGRLGVVLDVVCVKIQSEKQNNYSISNKGIEPLTQETINSVRQFHQRDSPMRKPSLNRVSSAKSFKRYGNLQQKQSGFIVQKRAKQTHDKSQDLYMLMLCQASTIQQIL